MDDVKNLRGDREENGQSRGVDDIGAKLVGSRNTECRRAIPKPLTTVGDAIYVQ